MKLYYDTFESPVGMITVVYQGNALVYVAFDNSQARKQEALTRRYGRVELIEKSSRTIRQCFKRYFKGEPHAFDSLEYDVEGTEFQKMVWKALCDIPYGKTISYAELAEAVDNPKAVRAAGSANGKNPLSIVIPCHRVINKDGGLGGYGGGTDKKRQLLNHEGVTI